MRPKLISTGISVSKLKGIQRDACAEQMGPKVKVVGLPCAIRKPDRFKTEVLELVEAVQLGNLGVKTSAAKLAVPFLHGTEVDDGVARRDLTARVTTGFLGSSGLDSIHFH